MKSKEIRRLVAAALCIALGVTLPQAFHMIPNAGSVFLPMHIPVLLCGLICGWKYGLIVGLVTPALSSLITGMPGAAVLPGMVCELGAYGLVSGICIQLIRSRRRVVNLYASLVCAMLVGRIFSGVLNALIFRAGDYGMTMWLTASFVTALPGIIIQLCVIPALVMALEKARVLPSPAAL